MTALIDTDVLIDLALERHPFADDAAALIDYLVTRNTKHYKKSPILAIRPSEFLNHVKTGPPLLNFPCHFIPSIKEPNHARSPLGTHVP